MAESGWSNTITNGGRPYDPYNVAYGIPQALPAIKMGAAANPPESNPTAQIHWMYNYMMGSYGGIENAWAFHLSHGWYDKGGLLPPGLSLAMNQTGRPERILPPSAPDPGQGYIGPRNYGGPNRPSAQGGQ